MLLSAKHAFCMADVLSLTGYGGGGGGEFPMASLGDSLKFH